MGTVSFQTYLASLPLGTVDADVFGYEASEPKLIPTDTFATQAELDAVVISGGGLTVASDAEAAAGTNNTKAMSPARTRYILATHGAAIFNGVTYTTIQAAVDAADTAGSGVVLVRPGVYDEQIVLDGTGRVAVVAHGATLRATGNGQTVVSISKGTGLDGGTRVTGCKVDGNGFTGVTGVQIGDSVGGSVADVYIEDCAVGLRFVVDSDTLWTEFCGADRVFIYNCAVGIEYDDERTGVASFNECWLSDVAVTMCDLGIVQRDAADFTRTTWRNVTVWVFDNQTAVEFAGRMDHCRLQLGIESQETTNIVGIHFASTATAATDARSVDLEVSFVGTFTTQVDNDSATAFCWRDGGVYRDTGFQTSLAQYHDTELHPRVTVGTAGIALGPGDATPIASLSCQYADYVTMTGRYFFQSPTTAPLAIGTQTGTTYTLALADASSYLRTTHGSGCAITVPPNSSVAFPVGTYLDGVGTAAAVTIVAGGGVTINKARTLVTNGADSGWSLIKVGTDEWDLHGDFA